MTWYRVEPLAEVWENPTPVDERRSRYAFKATFGQSLDLLNREIRMLDPDRPWDATKVILQIACRPADIRLDGGLRADARTDHPGVRVTFDTERLGQLSYGTDCCEAWQHNLRSIALGLEALRAVDRYGITTSGQQYTGFKALPAGRAMPASHMTSDQAYAVLERIAIGDEGEYRDRNIARMRAEPMVLRDVYKMARKTAHPDHRDGDRTAWDQIEQAATVLGLIA